ncbi:MAG: ferrous iron transporter B, partial [Thaumarchaeota archaeon]
MERRMIKVALAGNPNVGKSVIFNNLTGAHQHVGNWPGKTVDKKEGFHRVDDRVIYVVDLPGTYSLTALSVEEVIARDYIIYERPDVVVDIVDASNLERNLYLTMQLLELGANVVIALNKVDLAEKAGMRIDHRRLEEELGVPVIPTIAPKRKGMKELVEKIIELAERNPGVHSGKKLRYEPRVERFIERLQGEVASREKITKLLNPRWVAIKLLEGDEDVIKKLSEIDGGKEIIERGAKLREEMGRELGDPEVVMADARYAVIRGIVSRVAGELKRLTASDLLDHVLLDKYLG